VVGRVVCTTNKVYSFPLSSQNITDTKTSQRLVIFLIRDENESTSVSFSFFLTTYALISLFGAGMLLLQEIVFSLAAVRAAKIIHSLMLDSVLRAPIRFFETTPVGTTSHFLLSFHFHLIFINSQFSSLVFQKNMLVLICSKLIISFCGILMFSSSQDEF
jgi:ABC-type multidrug transport system fused ATPase/permease subunit